MYQRGACLLGDRAVARRSACSAQASVLIGAAVGSQPMGGGASKQRRRKGEALTRANPPADAQNLPKAADPPAAASPAVVALAPAPAVVDLLPSVPAPSSADAPATTPAEADASPPADTAHDSASDKPPTATVSTPASHVAAPKASKAAAGVPTLRLVKLHDYINAARTKSSSLCYDFLEPSLYVDAALEDLMETVRNDTAVVSWRWPFRKPGTEDGWKDKFDEADEEAGRLQELPEDLLDTIASKRNTQTWLWLDWACVPQYGRGDTMKAIELSGIVYREAANMIMWEEDAVLGFRIGRQYMSRAWTLAERIQRRKKKLTMRDFLAPAKLDEVDALLQKFEQADESADWEAITSDMFKMLYGVLSPLPQGTEEEQAPDPDFVMKSPLEVAGLHTSSAFEATTFYVIDQVKVMGWVMQESIMNDLRGIKDQLLRANCTYRRPQYSGNASTGGIDGATYTKMLATGAKMEELSGHPPQSALWWRSIAKNVHAVLDLALGASLSEGGQGGWLLDYVCRSAATVYHAWSKRDLLICLLACGALEDKKLDAKQSLKTYDDVLERALTLLQLNGIESQLSLLLMKAEPETAETPSSDEVPSWHPLNFFGELVLPQSVYSKWNDPKSLAAFLDQTRTLVQRLGCRASIAAATLHSSGSQHTCGFAVVQDIDAVCGFTSWWPMAFTDEDKCGLVAWYQQRIAAYAASLAKKDWTNPQVATVDPTPETVEQVVQEDGEVDDPGTKLALRLTLFAQPGAKWFSGSVDAGQVANDLVVDMIWRFDDEGKAWTLESRQADLKAVSPSIVSGDDPKGVDPKDFNFEAVVEASMKAAKRDASSLLKAALA